MFMSKRADLNSDVTHLSKEERIDQLAPEGRDSSHVEWIEHSHGR